MKKKLFLFCFAMGIISCLSGCDSSDVEAIPKDSPDFSEDVSNTDTPTTPAVQLTAFEKLFQYGPLAAQNENELWGYIDSSGEYVIQPIYSNVKSFGENGLAIVKDASSELWGIIDTSGNYVVEPRFYNVIGEFSDGLLCVCDSDVGWGYIDESGSYAIPPQFLLGYAFSEGFARVSTRIERVDEFYTYYANTFINKSGELITNDVFGEAYDFSEGRALVKVGDPINGYYGYIDTSGNCIVQPQFDKATSFSDGMAFAHNTYNNNTVLFDLDGNVLAESSLYDVPSGGHGYPVHWYSNLCPVNLSDGTGAVYINSQGEIILPKSEIPYGPNVSPFYSGEFALASQNGMMGFIDLDGNWVIAPQYSSSNSSFSNGTVQMSNSEAMRLLDTSGNCLLEYRTDGRERPASDMRRDPMVMARYVDDGSVAQAGFMNRDASIAIDYIFENASDFAYDCSYARAQSGGLWGMIDINGNWLIPARFMKFMINGYVY